MYTESTVIRFQLLCNIPDVGKQIVHIPCDCNLRDFLSEYAMTKHFKTMQQ